MLSKKKRDVIMVVLLNICFFPTLVIFSDFNWERFEFTGCMCVLTIQVIFVCSFMIVASFKMGNFCWLLNLLFYCYSTFLSDFIYVLLCHEIGWIHSICVCALQAASLDKIASLVKNDVLTMEGPVCLSYIIFVFI